jgi:hypothetical protein
MRGTFTFTHYMFHNLVNKHMCSVISHSLVTSWNSVTEKLIFAVPIHKSSHPVEPNIYLFVEGRPLKHYTLFL